MIDYLAMARSQGREDALDLRGRAKDMDGTAIIAEEHKIPTWEKKDYSAYPAGAPVQHEGQDYKIITPHDARNYDGTPATLPALYSICHTKDASKAKPWQTPNGTSGMYMLDECYKEGETVYRCKQDNVIHNYNALPEVWEIVK